MKSLLIAIVCAMMWASSAQAQGFPSRPITMIVPLPAGSAFDVSARVLAERMQVSLGQPVIVENVTGAAGSLGTGRVARSAPDGYTLVFGGLITHVINGAVLNLPYNVLNDFAPVSPVATIDLLIIAKKDMPANDLASLIDWLRTNPNKASQGSGGPGSLTHLAGVFFQKQTGTRFAIVPYRGAGSAINDVVAGQIDFMFDLASNSLAYIRAGTIKSYAVMAKARLRAAPDLSTVDEAGLPGFYMTAWEAIWAPRGTPKSIIDKLNAAVVDAVAQPAVASRLAEIGQEIFPRDQQSPDALAALQKAEVEKWWPIIKAANIKAE
jgi:tripartite-type tricarboxylate transporter receptor subunit TctC